MGIEFCKMPLLPLLIRKTKFSKRCCKIIWPLQELAVQAFETMNYVAQIYVLTHFSQFDLPVSFSSMSKTPMLLSFLCVVSGTVLSLGASHSALKGFSLWHERIPFLSFKRGSFHLHEIRWKLVKLLSFNFMQNMCKSQNWWKSSWRKGKLHCLAWFPQMTFSLLLSFQYSWMNDSR